MVATNAALMAWLERSAMAAAAGNEQGGGGSRGGGGVGTGREGAAAVAGADLNMAVERALEEAAPAPPRRWRRRRVRRRPSHEPTQRLRKFSPSDYIT